MRRITNFALLSLMMTGAALLSGCGGSGESAENNSETPPASITPPGNSDATPPTAVSPVSGSVLPPTLGATGQPIPQAHRSPHPIVLMKTSLGDITLKLDAEKAPLTVDNFLDNYVLRGFYDQTIFHYVDDGFMVAAGGFAADLKPKTPRAEILNEAHNGLKNRRYTIAMARNPDYVNSATSQFFINLADNTTLDYTSDENADTYGYCVFGEVVEGRDVIDRIAKAPVHDSGAFVKTPVEPVVILSVTRLE